MQELLSQLYGYLHGMWQYRWSALMISWVVALAGWIFVLSLPNQYTASAVIYVDTTSILKPLLKGLAIEYDTRDELRVMKRVLLSRDNLMSVIRETDMDLEVENPLDRERLVGKLSKSVIIKGGGGGRGDRSNIYEIIYQGDSPESVYKVVSKLLNTMIENTLNSSRTDTVAAQKFLDRQIGEYENRLETAEQKLAAFKKANVGFMPDEKGNYYGRLQAAKDTVENTLSQLRLAKQRHQELQKQLNGEKPILDSASYQSTNTIKLRQYQEQLASLLNQYTDMHPDVQSLKSIITDLKEGKDVGQLIGFDDASTAKKNEAIEFNPVYQELKIEASKASVEIQMLKIQLTEKRNSVVKLKNSIDIIPEVEAKLAKLNRDYAVTKGRYLTLVERRESARLAQDAGQSTSDVTFRVIEPPIVPITPSGPKRLLMLTAFLLMAIAAGVGWSFLRYILKPTYISIQGVSKILGVPILGSASLYLSLEHRLRRRKQLITFASTATLLLIVSFTVLIFRDLGTYLVGSIIQGLWS